MIYSCPETESDVEAVVANPPIHRGEQKREAQPREIGEEENGAGRDLLRDDLRGVPLLAVHGQGPRLDRPPPGREERKDGKGAGDKENASRANGPSKRE